MEIDCVDCAVNAVCDALWSVVYDDVMLLVLIVSCCMDGKYPYINTPSELAMRSIRCIVHNIFPANS